MHLLSPFSLNRPLYEHKKRPSYNYHIHGENIRSTAGACTQVDHLQIEHFIRKHKQINSELVNWFRSVVVITLASHARGPGFEPQRNHFSFDYDATFRFKYDVDFYTFLCLIKICIYTWWCACSST